MITSSVNGHVRLVLFKCNVRNMLYYPHVLPKSAFVNDKFVGSNFYIICNNSICMKFLYFQVGIMLLTIEQSRQMCNSGPTKSFPLRCISFHFDQGQEGAGMIAMVLLPVMNPARLFPSLRGLSRPFSGTS